MELKTYSRARSAIAAAKKALAHIDAFIVDIDSTEKGEKFGAVVTIKSGGGKDIENAVRAAGFEVIRVRFEAPAIEPTAAAVAPEMPTEAAPEQRPAPEVDDEYEDEYEDEDEADADEDPVDENSVLEEVGADPDDALPPAAEMPKKRGGYINEVSNVMGACELARSIANAMPNAPRKEVIAACRQAGIAYGTARTQIQRVRGGK